MISFIKFIVNLLFNVNEKKLERMKEIKYTILYCVSEITVPVPVPLRQKVDG
jgi:hypothetical protein